MSEIISSGIRRILYYEYKIGHSLDEAYEYVRKIFQHEAISESDCGQLYNIFQNDYPVS